MSADGARKLFVGGLGESVSEDAVRGVFANAGFALQHLALPRDRETGRLRGFAFATFATAEDAARAHQQLQGVLLEGRPLNLRPFSEEPPKRGAERPQRNRPEPTVFLGKLPFAATEADITQLFADHGISPVVRVTLPAGPDGRPRGFGFAIFDNPENVKLAIEKVNGATLQGRQIVVTEAQPKGGRGGGARPPRGPRGEGGRFDGPRSDGPPRREPARSEPAGRPSNRPPPSFRDDFEPPMMDAPFPPPDRAEGRGRRKGKERKTERRRSGGGEPMSGGSPRGGRKKRGGGASWHRWESDDD